MAGRGRERAVRLGIPALIVAALALVALWRVGAPPPRDSAPASGASRAAPRPPLTQLPDLIAPDAVGRQASVENVLVRDTPSPRTLWIGDSDADQVFVVLDPDVKRSHEARVVAGGRVTLIGLVRASPRPEVATRQWSLDAETAQSVADRGIYLHVTEVRPAG